MLLSMVFLIFFVIFRLWSQYIVHSNFELIVLLSVEIEASEASFNSTLLFLKLTELTFCCDFFFGGEDAC